MCNEGRHSQVRPPASAVRTPRHLRFPRSGEVGRVLSDGGVRTSPAGDNPVQCNARHDSTLSGYHSARKGARLPNAACRAASSHCLPPSRRSYSHRRRPRRDSTSISVRDSGGAMQRASLLPGCSAFRRSGQTRT